MESENNPQSSEEKELERLKKYLSDINSLLLNEAYQNEGMYELKRKTEEKIKELEAETCSDQSLD
jgi:hypothetical protein